MGNILVVNSTSAETRVALVENGIITEFYLERSRDQNIVGNIYKGRVMRVLPGMQAAFVDVGHERAGFLHVSDFFDFDEDEEDQYNTSGKRPGRKVNIQDVIKEGQEIIVQIAKEAMGTKGPRLTGKISIPGRYVVYMPTVSHIGISRRIESDKNRRRLRKIVERNRPQGAGFIVRTASQEVSDDKLERDMKLLVQTWEEILERGQKVRAPYLLNEEPGLLLRATRDLFTTDLEKLIVDDEEAYDMVCAFTKQYMPTFLEHIEYYQKPEPVFDAYGIEIELNRALQRQVELPSGGHLVIDKTEALTAIDINTGRFTGESNSHEETIYKTNLEAVDEVVYQLRLRNIGGIIVIDFIDMDHPKHRREVYRRLEQALEKDKVTSNVLAISELGLVEMTRKRTRESLSQVLCNPCTTCHERTFTKSTETLAYELLREIKREAAVLPHDTLYVSAYHEIVDFVLKREANMIDKIKTMYSKKLKFSKFRDRGKLEHFEVRTTPKAKTSKSSSPNNRRAS